MSREFSKVDRETAWLPEDHLARIVAGIADDRPTSACRHGGKRACHPGDYATAVFPRGKGSIGELEDLSVRILLMARWIF